MVLLTRRVTVLLCPLEVHLHSLWGGGEGEREMEQQVQEVARGRGEGFHILFQIMMYSEACAGPIGRTEPDRRPLCLEARLCRGV